MYVFIKCTGEVYIDGNLSTGFNKEIGFVFQKIGLMPWLRVRDNVAISLKSSFTDETPTGQEEVSLTVHLDNEDFPTFTLTLYRLDGTNCIATADGKTVALVSRSKTVDLIEAVNELTLGS